MECSLSKRTPLTKKTERIKCVFIFLIFFLMIFFLSPFFSLCRVHFAAFCIELLGERLSSDGRRNVAKHQRDARAHFNTGFALNLTLLVHWHNRVLVVQVGVPAQHKEVSGLEHKNVNRVGIVVFAHVQLARFSKGERENGAVCGNVNGLVAVKADIVVRTSVARANRVIDHNRLIVDAQVSLQDADDEIDHGRVGKWVVGKHCAVLETRVRILVKGIA